MNLCAYLEFQRYRTLNRHDSRKQCVRQSSKRAILLLLFALHPIACRERPKPVEPDSESVRMIEFPAAAAASELELLPNIQVPWLAHPGESVRIRGTIRHDPSGKPPRVVVIMFLQNKIMYNGGIAKSANENGPFGTSQYSGLIRTPTRRGRYTIQAMIGREYIGRGEMAVK